MRTVARRALALGLLLCAGPAGAQDADLFQRGFDLEMQLTQARQREVDLRNQLMALEARQQAEQAIRAIEALRDAAPIRLSRADGPLPAPPAPERFATIPDARLAASNARVRAALAR